MRQSRNTITEEINKLRKQGLDFKKKVQEAKELPEKIKQSDERALDLKEKIDYYLMRIPNILHESVPYGKDEAENKVEFIYGAIDEKDFEVVNHGDLLIKHKLADFSTAADVSGNGFYFLFGDIAMLEQALIS